MFMCLCVVEMVVCVCVCVCVCVSVRLRALRGHITLSESYRVEPNQPQGRTYHFQHYLTLRL